MVLNAFKGGVNMVLHPSRETHAKLGVKEALVMYYKFALVSMGLTAIASFFALIALPSALAYVPANSLINNSISQTVAVYRQYLISLIITPVFVPIALLIVAGLIHIAGKTFRLFEGDFSRTFAAVVYAEFASLLFWFAIVLGVIGSIVYFIALLYGVYVLVVGLSKQHSTSITGAFVPVLVAFAFLVIVVMVFASAFAAAAGVAAPK